MKIELASLCVGPQASVREAIALMDRNRCGFALVVDGDRHVVGTVTDGDIRRAMLANMDLQQPITDLLARKIGTRYERPVTARVGQESSVYLNLLKHHNLLYLPLLDETDRVAGLVGLDEFVPDETLSLQAVVMAGGRGSRLHPLTEDVPKPMLRVGDQPVLEIIIKQLRDAGIKQVKVTTHHKPEKITEHFGDGSHFGVELSYVEEGRPLGTVGGLGLLAPPKETTLVMNGDILTQVDFRAMLAYHREHQADLTMAVRQYDVNVPYGIVECDGPMVRGVTEKPVLGFFVNAGIYLLEPSVCRLIPNGQRFDMTELIQRVVGEGRAVVSFPIREYWLDIGQHEDYVQAQADSRHWHA